MGGGPSTPALAGAVSEAGGLGFLAAGYRSAAAVRDEIGELRRLTERPFGINLFVPGPALADRGALEAYASTLKGEAERYGVELGEPVHDDDGWDEKLALLAEERVPVVSVTFGLPARRGGRGAPRRRLRAVGHGHHCSGGGRRAGGWRRRARGAGRGGRRAPRLVRRGRAGQWACSRCSSWRAVTDLPLVATGGIATGRGIAAVLAAGAAAAQLGTAFMLTPEAATSPAHREALRGAGPTALTRAFTGRSARGIENRFMREHEADAPLGYPRCTT